MQGLRLAAFASLVHGCSALVFSAKHAEDGSPVLDRDQELKVLKLVDGSDCLGGWNAINPSFVAAQGSADLAVAFRGLCLKRSGRHASWFSETVIGTVHPSAIRSESREEFQWKSLGLAPDPRFHDSLGHNLRQCSLEDTDDVEGAEDPRLVDTGDGLYLIVTGYHVQPHSGPGSPECGEHAVLLFAAKVESLSPPAFGPPKELLFPGMGKTEKNWAMFTPPELLGSAVRAVYSIYPHKIASVDLSSGEVGFVATTWPPAFQKLAAVMRQPPENFHGGAGVAHVNASGGEYFLSVAHVIVLNSDRHREYRNFPYRFEARAPYKVLQVGKKLDLVLSPNPAYGASVAFVTTLMFADDEIFIGYGSGDSSSRTLRMPLQTFNSQYFSSDFTEGAADDIFEETP